MSDYFHITNFGSFARTLLPWADSEGFVDARNNDPEFLAALDAAHKALDGWRARDTCNARSLLDSDD
jgi:hypothetical protein